MKIMKCKNITWTSLADLPEAFVFEATIEQMFDWRTSCIIEHLFIYLIQTQTPNLTCVWMNNLTLGINQT